MTACAAIAKYPHPDSPAVQRSVNACLNVGAALGGQRSFTPRSSPADGYLQ
jgi:hypothetical protein